MPLGLGWGQNVGLRDFCHILILLPPGASVFYKHMSSCVKVSNDVNISIELHFVGIHRPYELHRKEEQIKCTA